MGVILGDGTDAGADDTDGDFFGIQRFQAVDDRGQRALDVGFDDDVELVESCCCG